MTWLYDLITNPFFITAVSSWLVAQELKVIIYGIINKNLDLERLFGDGGLPSGHSATVSSMAVISAFLYGTGSFEFAISAVLAIIVCHDAMGVRLETGKQAAVINEIVRSFSLLAEENLPEVKLKEFVGHTPIQVMAGILIGVINACVMFFLIL